MKGKHYGWSAAGAILVTLATICSHPLQASASRSEDCKTGTYVVTDRPDSGQGGHTWALDTFTRNIKACRVMPDIEAKTVEVESWEYNITGKDVGTFKTQGDKTPKGESGGSNFAGREGQLEGQWSLTFTAPANWAGWQGDTEKPNRNDLSTSEWVAALWSGEPNGYKPNEFKHWQWIYDLCDDQWINASGGNTGDITGDSGCVPPTDPPATSPPASEPPVTESPTPAPGVGGGSPELPVTGARTAIFTAGAGILIMAGLAAYFLARERRKKFKFTS